MRNTAHWWVVIGLVLALSFAAFGRLHAAPLPGDNKTEAKRTDATADQQQMRLEIDGQLVAHYIYSSKELEALHKGGVQRIYVGNVTTGDHQLNVLVDGKLKTGADFSRTEHFTFHKEVKPKFVELTMAGPDAGKTPITLGEW